MLSGFALFDSRLSFEEKRKIVLALENNGTDNPPRRISVDKSTILDKNLSDFVTKNSAQFFLSNNISLEFLVKDPSLWEDDENFISARGQAQS